MLWVKTLHVLFVIAWMAGLFYLPRILVHYVEGTAASEDTRRLVVMADKLLRFSVVMAIPAIAFGTWLWLGYGLTGGWMHAKLTLVVLLIGYQIQSYRYVTRMKNGEVWPSSVFFRVFNEAALIIVVPILILVIVKPF